MKDTIILLLCAVALANSFEFQERARTCNCDPSEAEKICQANFGDDNVIISHENCDKFYQCSSGKPVAIRCPAGLLYNPLIEICDWPDNVDCGDRPISEDSEDDAVSEEDGGGDSDDDSDNVGTCNCDPSEAPSICAVDGSDGVLVAHANCNQYYMCANGRPITFTCGPTLLYNPYTERCDWSQNIVCGDRVIPEPDDDADNDLSNEDDDENDGTCNCKPEEAPIICAAPDSGGVLVAHEYCNQYYICDNGRPIAANCSGNLLFNPYTNACDWPRNVECGDRIVPEFECTACNESGENGESPPCDDSDNDSTDIDDLPPPGDDVGSDSADVDDSPPPGDDSDDIDDIPPPGDDAGNDSADIDDRPPPGDDVGNDSDDVDDMPPPGDDAGSDSADIDDRPPPGDDIGNDSSESPPSDDAGEDNGDDDSGNDNGNNDPDDDLGNDSNGNDDNNVPDDSLGNDSNGNDDENVPDDSLGNDDGGNGNDIDDSDCTDNDNIASGEGCNCKPEEAPSICAFDNSDGVLIAHEYCNHFYKCDRNRPVAIKCPANLLYNPLTEVCDWPYNVDCGDRVIPDSEEDNDASESQEVDDGDSDNDNVGTCNCNPEEAPAICAVDGSNGVLIAHQNCNQFYQCSFGIPVAMICPPNLLYNPYIERCDWKENVECGERVIPDPEEDNDNNDSEDDEEESDSGNNEVHDDPSQAPSICSSDNSEGVLVAHENCTQFYVCSGGSPVALTCSGELLFNPQNGQCDWPSNVDCGDRIIPDDSCACNFRNAPAICSRSDSHGKLVAHEYCNQFYMCVDGIPVARDCPASLYYNPDIEACDWPQNVKCQAHNRMLPFSSLNKHFASRQNLKK